MLQEIVADVVYQFVLFFFSSRRRHTRLQGDWSSDVCSSDLLGAPGIALGSSIGAFVNTTLHLRDLSARIGNVLRGADWRSEERRVGKECRSRWSPYH